VRAIEREREGGWVGGGINRRAAEVYPNGLPTISSCSLNPKGAEFSWDSRRETLARARGSSGSTEAIVREPSSGTLARHPLISINITPASTHTHYIYIYIYIHISFVSINYIYTYIHTYIYIYISYIYHSLISKYSQAQYYYYILRERERERERERGPFVVCVCMSAVCCAARFSGSTEKRRVRVKRVERLFSHLVTVIFTQQPTTEGEKSFTSNLNTDVRARVSPLVAVYLTTRSRRHVPFLHFIFFFFHFFLFPYLFSSATLQRLLFQLLTLALPA
jgi:hypothetical protein